jgi:tRNA threonylcarbamoyladenosine modification (KEOPS) complex Cgi121 subunit
MKKKNFFFSEDDLRYSVIINTIKIQTHNLSLTKLFDILQTIQNEYPDSIIQFFNPCFLVNEDHLFYAIYYTQKAFKYQHNISQKPSIELLLYLSANRQIQKAINSFGITRHDLHEGALNYCVVAYKVNPSKINKELLQNFDHKKTNVKYNEYSLEKYKRIKSFFKISDHQIETSLHSLGDNISPDSPRNESLEELFQALIYLIIEKMALLSLENC